MLKSSIDSAQTMTIQNLESLDSKSAETMQNISDKGQNPQQPLTASKNGHISFSVASLLADTRPNRSSSPVSQNSSCLPSSESPQHHSSDEEYDSNQEDSIVDVEDLNAEQKSDVGSKSDEFLGQRDFPRDGNLINQGPIRPTPFSALAAAVYQAAHPNWAHQGLVGPFSGPGPIFQGAGPFGVPNLTTGKEWFRKHDKII